MVHTTEFDFNPEEIANCLETMESKAGGLLSAAEDKIQEIVDAKSTMEDAQSDLEEALSTLGTLPETIEKYDNALTDLENVEVYY